jgi:glycine cleavage system H protein
MDFPKNLQYSATHEWVELLDSGRVRIGITDYAQDQLGDLVFVDLPEVGDRLTAGQSFADVESVKAVSEVIAPVSGTVTAVNTELQSNPEKMNEAPYYAWFVEVENAAIGEGLMDAAQYEAFCRKESTKEN